MEDLTIGMIGLDTSHAIAFTRLLNDSDETYHIKGAKVETAFPGGTEDFELSRSRVGGFTSELRDSFGVSIADTMETVADKSDAILLESVDGRVHLEQLRKIISYKKPIFIDKPFCLSTEDAQEMIRLSELYETPIMSTSALRFSEGLTSVLDNQTRGKIIGADCFGPMELQEQQPGFFWYGIHAVEMLFTILGEGSDRVVTVKNDDHDLLTGVWKDGRIGTVRGNRKGNFQFGAVVHFEGGSEFVSIHSKQKPYYASLLEQIMLFFENGVSRIPLSETKEIIRFIEAANESRDSGKSVLI
ncbi:Gfo/Idh/MocA family protein [Oceanobacillus chungangensis]|uniref:Oxidoreductase n=1 Tax=Oceanobacillus chungangensis TaxID=1229152 RepID=A0A3D8PZ78_9BACI|nr:Gfo/Idh/MocA family oxidoreductase [Oceanobacillus chungangensis]RDW20651.1 oxidoreductase [Oceanobacillus chungangensis]